MASSLKDDALMTLYVDRYPQVRMSAMRWLAWKPVPVPARFEVTDPPGTEGGKAWTLAQRQRLRPLLQVYLDRYPTGSHADEARQLLTLLPDLNDTTPGALCDRLATIRCDATAGISGVPYERLQQNAVAAIRACSAAVTQSPDLPHYVALLARATAASGDLVPRHRPLRKRRRAWRPARHGQPCAIEGKRQRHGQGRAGRDGALRTGRRRRQPDAMINLAVTLFEGKDLPRMPTAPWRC